MGLWCRERNYHTTTFPTTAADVIRAITTHVQAASGPNDRPVTEGHVRLHLDPSNLIGINSNNVNKPLPELIPSGTYPLKWSVVNGLSFLLAPLPSGLDETISMKIVSQDGQSLFFKIKSTTVLHKLCDAWLSRMGVDRYSVHFMFDGTRIDPRLTAECYGLEDGDVIDVELYQQGD